MAIQPGDAYAAYAFLGKFYSDKMGFEPSMAMVLLLDSHSPERKEHVISELQRIGAIEHVDGKWTITDEGMTLYNTYVRNNLM